MATKLINIIVESKNVIRILHHRGDSVLTRHGHRAALDPYGDGKGVGGRVEEGLTHVLRADVTPAHGERSP